MKTRISIFNQINPTFKNKLLPYLPFDNVNVLKQFKLTPLSKESLIVLNQMLHNIDSKDNSYLCD